MTTRAAAPTQTPAPQPIRVVEMTVQNYRGNEVTSTGRQVRRLDDFAQVYSLDPLPAQEDAEDVTERCVVRFRGATSLSSHTLHISCDAFLRAIGATVIKVG